MVQVAKKKLFKVIQTFNDKFTHERYEIGDFYEADAKRLKELQSKGFIEEVNENEPDK